MSRSISTHIEECYKKNTHIEEIIWLQKVSRAQLVDFIQTLDSVLFVSLYEFYKHGMCVGC